MRRNFAYLNLVELERQELRAVLTQELEAVQFASQETDRVSLSSGSTGKVIKSRLATTPTATTTATTMIRTKKHFVVAKDKSNGNGIEPHRLALDKPANPQFLQLKKQQMRMHTFAEATVNASTCWDRESQMLALNMLICPDEFNDEESSANGGMSSTDVVESKMHLIKKEEASQCPSRSTPWQESDIGMYFQQSCKRPTGLRKTGPNKNSLNSSSSSTSSSGGGGNNSPETSCLERAPVRIMIQSV